MSKLLHRLNVLPISEPSCSGFQSKGSKHVKTSSRFFFKLWCTKHPRNLCQNPGRICRSEESWSPSGRLVDAAAARRWDARLGDVAAVAAVAGAGGGGGGGMSDPAHASKHPGHCCDCSSVAPANPCGLPFWFSMLVFYVGFYVGFLMSAFLGVNSFTRTSCQTSLLSNVHGLYRLCWCRIQFVSSSPQLRSASICKHQLFSLGVLHCSEDHQDNRHSRTCQCVTVWLNPEVPKGVSRLEACVKNGT